MDAKRLAMVLGGVVILGGAGLVGAQFLMPDSLPDSLRFAAAEPPPPPPPPPAPKPVDTTPVLPATEGILWRAPDQVSESSLTVEAPPGRLNYVVQLFREPGHNPALIVYCGAGQTHTVPVSAGSYTVSYSFGEKWHGFPSLFGVTTASETLTDYLRFEDKAGPGQTLKFGAPVLAPNLAQQQTRG